MAHLSEKRMGELKEAFVIADKDGDDRINMPELGNVMRSIGLCPTEAQLATIAQEYGASVSGKGGKLFDLEECRRITQKNINLVETKDSLRECFRIFDKDGNGYVSASEVRHVLTSLGENLRDDEVDGFIRGTNLTQDGQFSYEEACEMLMNPL